MQITDRKLDFKIVLWEILDIRKNTSLQKNGNIITFTAK